MSSTQLIHSFPAINYLEYKSDKRISQMASFELVDSLNKESSTNISSNYII